MLRLGVLLASTLACEILSAAPARGGPFVPGGDPRVDPADFEVTTFASALPYPMGATLLRDGSLLFGVSRGGSLFTGPHELVRLVDSNGDGVADGPATVAYSGLSGPAFSLSRIDDWLIAATQRSIVFLRQPGNASSALVRVAQLDLAYPNGWWHPSTSIVGFRRAASAGRVELFFNVGSEFNELPSVQTVAASGLFTAALSPESIYRWTVDLTGSLPSTVELTRIAAGLRNAYAGGVDPIDGSLLLAENGIDTPGDLREALSADELNAIGAADLGGVVEDFGFPSSYEAYRTGVHVGTTGLLPLVAFQPIPAPDGAESEGAAGFAFAPFRFPAGLERGAFVGFHGQFEFGGAANEENPIAFVELPGGSHFHFVSAGEPALGHPDTLLATADALFVFDPSAAGPISGAASGAIHRIALAQSCSAGGGDGDRDGICDSGPAPCSCSAAALPACARECADNCPLRANPDQLDRTPDGVGDACSCGDLDADGDADASDVDAYRRRLSGAAAAFSLDRCNLDSASACDLRDATRLRRSLAGATAGRADAAACDAARIP